MDVSSVIGTTKYTKKQIKLFTSKTAIKDFLEPIGLYTTFPTKSFSQDKTPIKKQQPYFKALQFVKFKLNQAVETQNRVEYWSEFFIRLRNRLVSANRGLVYGYAMSSTVDIEREEKVGVGYLGLIRAVELFNPWKNFQFSTYAYTSIRNRVVGTWYKTKPPSLIDIYEVDIPEEEEDTSNDLLLERIAIAVKNTKMTSLERKIIKQRFFSGSHVPLSRLSALHKLCPERIRQIQNDAIEKIKNTLQDDTNVENRPQKKINYYLSESQKKQIEKLHKQGLSGAEIGRRMKRSKHAVVYFLRKRKKRLKKS